MMYTLSLQILGVPVEVSSSLQSHVGELEQRFVECAYPTIVSDPVALNILKNEPGSAKHRVELEGRHAHLKLGDTWPRLDDMVQLLVERQRSDLAFVHGACIASDEGAIVLFGDSTAGKSTLALALRQHGFVVLAEDTTPVELKEGRVYPFPTRAGIRAHTENIAKNEQWDCSQTRIAESMFTSGVPIRHLIHLSPITDLHSSFTSEVNLEEWSRMLSFTQPVSRHTITQSTKSALVRNEHSFARKPVLEDLPPIEGIRLLLNHSRRCGSLVHTLRDISQSVHSFTFHRLTPGYLPASVGILQGLLH